MSIPSSTSGILNFCANNYLGLSSHPEVIQAGLQALEEFGAGLSSTRFICGTQVPSGCCGGWRVPCPQRWALTPTICFPQSAGPV